MLTAIATLFSLAAFALMTLSIAGAIQTAKRFLSSPACSSLFSFLERYGRKKPASELQCNSL
jgi:hypothetical protein